MNKKINALVIGLAVFSFVSVGIALFMYAGKSMAEQKHADAMKTVQKLQNANEELGARFTNAENEKRQLVERLQAMQEEMDAVNQASVELNQQYEVAQQEKAQLQASLDDIKNLQQAQQPQVAGAANDAYWASMVKKSAELEIAVNTLKKTLEDTQLKNAEVQTKKAELEMQVSELSKSKDDLQRQFDYNRRLVETLAADLVREKNDSQTIKRQAKTLREENDVLSSQLKQMMAAKLNLEKQLDGFMDEKNGLENKLSNVGSVLNQRLEELIELQKQVESGAVYASRSKESVELPPIVVKSQSPQPALAEQPPRPAATSGQEAMSMFAGAVVSIDEKNNFVIIDIGKNKGVQVGQMFDVYSGAKKTATLEVVQVRDDIAACDITQLTGRISVGHKIR
jgi:hypothetical protein